MVEFHHAAALAATIKESPALQSRKHAALVRLAVSLARQMDAAGSEPSTRLSAAYLSVLKDIGRVTASEKQRPDDGGKRKLLAEMRAGKYAPRASDPGMPFDSDDAAPAGTAFGTGTGTGTGTAGVRQADDAATLAQLDPPPRSRRDVMERLGWGTTRAAAALRGYREETGRG